MNNKKIFESGNIYLTFWDNKYYQDGKSEIHDLSWFNGNYGFVDKDVKKIVALSTNEYYKVANGLYVLAIDQKISSIKLSSDSYICWWGNPTYKLSTKFVYKSYFTEDKGYENIDINKIKQLTNGSVYEMEDHFICKL